MTAHVLRLAVLVSLTLPSLVAGPSLSADAPVTPSDARMAFERLRALAGTWTFTTADDHGRVSYEVVSSGSVILERVMNDEHGPAGMLSMIHLDGSQLVLQHYCSAGNQPRLVASGVSGDEIRFSFERAGNLPTPAGGHIHAATFRFPATGTFESSWTWRENGVDTTSTRRHAR